MSERDVFGVPERVPDGLASLSQLRVGITFHGPFRVGTGEAGAGFHTGTRQKDPLPASSLKGLMRASARQLLPSGRPGDGPQDDLPLLRRVFGARGAPCPWSWTGAEFPDEALPPRTVVRARVEIDDETGTAREGHLRFAQELWAREATFTVAQTGLLPPRERSAQLAVLACAAAGVHALGGERRRGLGWVTCTPVSPSVDDELLDFFEQLRDLHV